MSFITNLNLNHKPVDDIDQLADSKPHTINEISPPNVEQKTLDDYLHDKEIYELTNMTIHEKIFYYHRKGLSCKEITSRLSVSLEEVNLVLFSHQIN